MQRTPALGPFSRQGGQPRHFVGRHKPQYDGFGDRCGSAPRKSFALNQNPKPLNPRTENIRLKRSLIFRGMQERSDASKSQVDPESKQKWGGDLCTTPTKEFEEPRLPDGMVRRLVVPECHSYLRLLGQDAHKLLAQKSRLQTTERELLARPSRLRATTTVRQRSGGPRKKDCGAAAVWQRSTGQWVQQSRRNEVGGRQPTPPAGGTREPMQTYKSDTRGNAMQIQDWRYQTGRQVPR